MNRRNFMKTTAGLVVGSTAMIIPASHLMALPRREIVLAGCGYVDVKDFCGNVQRKWVPKHAIKRGHYESREVVAAQIMPRSTPTTWLAIEHFKAPYTFQNGVLT